MLPNASWELAPAQAKSSPSKSVNVPAAIKAAQKKFGMPSSTPIVVRSKKSVTTLAQLVDLMRIAYPDAVVTSTFYDYRTVSMYRRNPGLHLGYDIAMPAGASVRAGWPGSVVSIAPWADGEWGVTVASSNGTEVTYGHIRPDCYVGKSIDVGDVVGHVSVNHVDVKMRDGNGNYVPFGEGEKNGLPYTYTYTKIKPISSREQLMVAWLTANNSLETTEMELDARKREVALNKIERRQLEERYASLNKTIKLLGDYYDQGFVSKRDVEKAHKDFANAKTQLQKCKKRQKDNPQQIAKLQKQLQYCSTRRSKAAQQAAARGITWNDVNAFINNLVAKDEKLSKKVENYKSGQSNKTNERMAELKKAIDCNEKELAEKEALYEIGGISQNDIKDQRQKLELLKAQLKALPTE